MNQPIIDPNKVNGWMESMRGVFGDNALGMWLVVGIMLAFLLFVFLTAWSVHHEVEQQRHRHV